MPPALALYGTMLRTAQTRLRDSPASPACTGVASMKSWGRALQSARKWPTSGLESIPVDRYKTDASYTLPMPPETRTTRLDLATRTDPGPAAIGVRILQILCVAQLLPYKRPHRNLHKNYTRKCVCMRNEPCFFIIVTVEYSSAFTTSK